jgi:uncharacterized protein (TIGR03435 family)
MKPKPFLLVKVISVAALALTALNLFATAHESGPQIGDVPPDLELSEMVQGMATNEVSWPGLRGKVVVLEFWATWCVPCIKAIPHLNELIDEFKDQPLVFLSITSEPAEKIARFLAAHPMKASIALDTNEAVKRAFQVSRIPHVAIVNAQGRIAAITHPALIQASHLKEILNGEPSTLSQMAYRSNATESELVGVEAAETNLPLYEISIRESKRVADPDAPGCMWECNPGACRLGGRDATVESALHFVFGKTPARMVVKTELPKGIYDFRLAAPAGHETELEDQFANALKSVFGLHVKHQLVQKPVYVLTRVTTNMPGLRLAASPGGGGKTRDGFRFNGCTLRTVAEYLEKALHEPVIDETGTTNYFNVNLKWELSDSEKMRQVYRRFRHVIEANPGGDWISDLPEELRQGPGAADATRLKAELAKPDAERFRADPGLVMKAVRTQLGLKLERTMRSIEVLEVSGGDGAETTQND